MPSFWVFTVYFAIFLLNVHPLNCEEVTQNNVQQLKVQSAVTEKGKTNVLKKTKSISYASLIGCVASLNPACFIDRSEDILLGQYNNFWVEANNEALISGRGSEENPPSKIMDGISKLISELTEILSQGISNFFRDSKEDDKIIELKEEGNEEEEEDEVKSRHLEETRLKKKKKKKIKAIIKLLIVGVVLAAKLSLLLKVLSFKLQIKFLLIALGGLLLNAARLFFDLKKGHQPQKVVYYEHAQHQHHYEGGDEEWTSGGHWDRSTSDQNTSPQDLAYSKQKPYATIYSRIADKPNYSWKD